MRIAITFVACALIWGSTFLAIRFGNEATPPVWAATIRPALALVLLFGITGAFRMRLPRGKALRGAALVTRKLIAAVVAIGGVALIFAGELGVSARSRACSPCSVPQAPRCSRTCCSSRRRSSRSSR
jgi:drug/metabolite transporter (DMT)-like permease